MVLPESVVRHCLMTGVWFISLGILSLERPLSLDVPTDILFVSTQPWCPGAVLFYDFIAAESW